LAGSIGRLHWVRLITCLGTNTDDQRGIAALLKRGAGRRPGAKGNERLTLIAELIAQHRRAF
jgi:hypothetical protein